MDHLRIAGQQGACRGVARCGRTPAITRSGCPPAPSPAGRLIRQLIVGERHAPDDRVHSPGSSHQPLQPFSTPRVRIEPSLQPSPIALHTRRPLRIWSPPSRFIDGSGIDCLTGSSVAGAAVESVPVSVASSRGPQLSEDTRGTAGRSPAVDLQGAGISSWPSARGVGGAWPPTKDRLRLGGVPRITGRMVTILTVGDAPLRRLGTAC